METKVNEKNGTDQQLQMILSEQQQEAGVFSDANTFEHGQRVAKMLCSSTLVPEIYRGNVQNTMIALEMANRIGASPLMVMQNLYIVQGKPSWSSSFIIAALNACNRFSPLRFEMSGEGDEYGCTAWALDLKTKDKLDGPKVTMAMVKAEGWLSKNGSKWKTMPELMFRYRAAAFFGRLYAPDILMGMHTMDEVTDFASPKEENPILLQAISMMQTAKTEDEFQLIKDSFADLSNDVDFQKNFLYYQRKNILK
jgi:hypothetical protein